MNNSEKTKAFFAATDKSTKGSVLDDIAKNYGITKEEAYEEVTCDEAESLLDYVTGQTRQAVSLLFHRNGLR